MTVESSVLALVLTFACLTACTEDESPVAGNADEACEAEPQWALADTVGGEGHGTPVEAATSTALQSSDLPDGQWYIVREQGDEAFLAPSEGPWRLEARRMEDLGWVVVTGLRCSP